jgi:hypothetical protein
VRLRLVVPRRGRRRGLGGLAAALAAAGALAGCGGSDAPRRITAATITAPVLPAPAQAAPAGRPRLGIGLTEFNPNLLRHGATPPAFAPWRDKVEALQPRWFRLLVEWDKLAPKPTAGLRFDLPGDGCLRGLPPCAPFAGIRDVLRAVASQQRAHPGTWQLLVVLTGTPDWAAVGAHGCEEKGTGPKSRPIDTEGLPGYRNLIRGIVAEARADGVAVRALSPWNEPNHPSFISPQRAQCASHAQLLSPVAYTALARAARDELAHTTTKLVLGELAGNAAPSPHTAGIGEFVRALPDDIACAGDVWSQHAYADPAADPSLAGPVGQLESALDARACTRGRPIWVTETGVGAEHAGRARSSDPAQLARGCRAQAATLRRWSRDARVQVAFQYLFREDTAYPVGLADARLTRTYPTYDLLRRASRRGTYSC